MTLFRYDLVEEASLRNQGKTTEVALLDRVMQLLYDDAIIEGPELQGALSGISHELRVSLSTTVGSMDRDTTSRARSRLKLLDTELLLPSPHVPELAAVFKT